MIFIALCIRLAYVFLLPPTQTVSFRLEGLNDEASHLNYVHYLAQHKQFPIQQHHARNFLFADGSRYPVTTVVLGCRVSFATFASSAVTGVWLFNHPDFANSGDFGNLTSPEPAASTHTNPAP